MDALNQIWLSVPAVAAAAEEQRPFVDIGAEGAALVLRAAYHACFSNVDEADSQAAVAEALKHPSVQPLPLPAADVAAAAAAATAAAPVEGESAPEAPPPADRAAGFGFNWLQRAVAEYVATSWVDLDGFAPSSPPSPGGEPQTPITLAIEALAACIVDDRPPNGLLPIAEVLLMPAPKRVAVQASDYVTLQSYPAHPPVFDQLWARAAGTAAPSAAGAAPAAADAELSQERFSAWFSSVYRYLYSNATPLRAKAAAEAEWFDAIAVTGRCTPDVFRAACIRIARLYGRSHDAPAFYRSVLEDWARGVERRVGDAAELLEDPVALRVADGLDPETCERDFFATPTANRVLVVGEEGTGKTTFGAALAARLNAVHLDVFSLAVEATADCFTLDDVAQQQQQGSLGVDLLGVAVARHVLAGEPVPLPLQSELVRRRVETPATGHRGFVLSDVPAATSDNAAAIEAFAGALGLDATLPQAVVRLHAVPAVYKEWRERAAKAADAEYEAELRLRGEERAERERVAAIVAEREARRKRIEERAERRAKIEAGEIEATEADLAAAAAGDEEDADVAEPPAPAADEVDEDGNPLEPEVIAARRAAAERVVARRRFLADLRMLLRKTRAVDATKPQEPPTTALRAFATAVRICGKRDRDVLISCISPTADQVEFVVERLQLVPSTVPADPAVPEDQLEGIEAGADGDVTLGEIKMRFATETLGCSLSHWQKLCPATWREQRVLVEGSPALMAVYRGKIYCFASPAKRARFIAAPHPYLLEDVTRAAPVLCVYRHGGVLAAAGIDRAAFEAQLAEGLGLTPITLAGFNEQWGRHRAEVARRAELQFKGAEANAKRAAAREERKRKRLEAEAKKKKAGDKGKKTATKGGKGGKGDEDAAAANAQSPIDDGADGAAAADGADGDAALAVETTEQRIAKVIAARLAEAAVLFPQLVSCADIVDEAQIAGLLERRVLPPTVVVVDHRPPPPPGAEGGADDNADGGEAGEDEDDDGADAAVAPGDEDLDPEEAAAAARARRAAKPFDPNDEKQFRRLTRRVLERLAAATAAAEEAIANGGTGGDDGSGAGGAAGEDGGALSAPTAASVAEREAARPLLPLLPFRVATHNAHGLDAAGLVSDVLHAVVPTAVQAQPPGDGEELVVDPEEPEETEDGQPAPDPALQPGRRAIHQFGDTLRYCPVRLRNERLLVAGDPALWLSFNGQRFLFTSQAAIDEFRRNPRRFVERGPRALPPPRLWLLGVPSAGKRTLARALSAKFDIPLFRCDADFFAAVIAAAESPTGGVVDPLGGGTEKTTLYIPHDAGSAALLRARAATEELAAFDRRQQERAELKERTLQAQAAREAAREAGDDVEELDEEDEAEIAAALEFEPEEPEARAERVGRGERRIAAALTRIEPFESRGYVFCGRPANDVELAQLLDDGCVPEAVVHVKLSPEQFVARRIDGELAQRQAAWRAAVETLAEKRKAQQLRQRLAELKRWRRRNIGVDDEPAAAGGEGEEEELGEEPEPVSADAVRAELEGLHEAESGNVAAVLGALPERRIPVVEVNGDWGRETVLSATVDRLAPALLRRRSLLEAPRVVLFDEAVKQVELGALRFSQYRFTDPVAHLAAAVDERESVAPRALREKPPKRRYVPEGLVPEPEPEPPKPKRMRVVKKEDEDGNEIEVEEEDPDAEDEAAAAAGDEPEEADEPEPEPELSPDELEEMQREHDAKVAAARNAAKMRAAVLRNRVYFFETKENLARFMREPLTYWDQPPPLPLPATIVAAFEDDPATAAAPGPVVPRTLAYQVAYNTGLTFIDLPRLVKWAFAQRHVPSLSQRAKHLLLSGDAIPSDFIGVALACRLQAVDVQRRGAVLLNLPRSPLVLSTLTAEAIAVHKVLVVREHERMAKELEALALVSHVVANPVGSMAALVECVNEIRASQRCRQQLALRRRRAFPASLRNTAVPNAQLAASLSVFQWYCPFMWARHKQLLDQRGDLRFAAEFLGAVYCFSSDECARPFYVHPEAFSGEEGPKPAPLPSLLPRRLSPAEATALVSAKPATPLELCGCCPVTLYNTRNEVGLRGVTQPRAVLGRTDLIAQYDGKAYALVDEDAMRAFLRQPWVFATGAVLPLPHKLPFDATELKAMPDEHYITRALYEEVARALLAVARTRPKFPGLSVEESALKYVALHLKAHNAASSEFRAATFRANFEAYVERATLYETITTEAPEDPVEREAFERRCRVWDEVQDNPRVVEEYIRLKAEGVVADPVVHDV